MLEPYLYLGNWLELAANLEDHSIDLICADIPYEMTALDYDKEKQDLQRMWLEYDRIAKKDANIVMFSAQPFTTRLINSAPTSYSWYEIIWMKSRPTQHKNSSWRPLQNHENIIVFRKSTAAAYNPQLGRGEPKGVINKASQGKGVYGKDSADSTYENQGERQPLTCVFYPNAQRPVLHPNQKPLDLLEYLIQTYSNERDLVFDSHFGSGTTAHACIIANRRFVGAEKDEARFKVASKRLKSVMSQPRMLEPRGSERELSYA